MPSSLSYSCNTHSCRYFDCVTHHVFVMGCDLYKPICRTVYTKYIYIVISRPTTCQHVVGRPHYVLRCTYIFMSRPTTSAVYQVRRPHYVVGQTYICIFCPTTCVTHVVRLSHYIVQRTNRVFKVQLIRAVRTFIWAIFLDKRFTLRRSPIVLYVARCLQ